MGYMAPHPIPLDPLYEFQHASLFRWQRLLRLRRFCHGNNRLRMIEGICHEISRTLTALHYETKRNSTSFLETDNCGQSTHSINQQLQNYKQKIHAVLNNQPILGERIIKSIHRFYDLVDLEELSKGQPLEWRISLSLLIEQEQKKPKKI